MEEIGVQKIMIRVESVLKYSTKCILLISYPLHKDVTHTVETIRPFTFLSAVIGRQEIVEKQKNVNFDTILRCLKSHCSKT